MSLVSQALHVEGSMTLQINAGIAKLSVGSPEDDSAIVPVVSKSSADFIEGLVKDAEAKGATLCQPYKREGNLIWPLLIDKVRRLPAQRT